MNVPQQSDVPAGSLAGSLTWASSRQAYYTIRFLADPDRMADAFRAYGYFRWVDDELDGRRMEKSERVAFALRENALLDRCYRGDWPPSSSDEERMLIDLIRGDREPCSGLQSYLRHMMAVMVFDAERRGRPISRDELESYTSHLAIAVTDALHFFIGHGCALPKTKDRYLAACGAHVVHMLRDTQEDVANGYYNVPREFLEARQLDPCEVGSEAYCEWFQGRAQLARAWFQAGRNYLHQLPSPRCRLAGSAYLTRFEATLEAIACCGYRVRPKYPQSEAPVATLRMAASTLWLSLRPRRLGALPRPL